MSVAELRPWLKDHWAEVRRALDEGTYRPAPVRRVTIPKPDGGERELGVPTVLDRLIQQAIAQTLTPVFDPHFSERSYGFRPGRSAHQAVQMARDYVAAGLDWVVDVDLERFFDRVQHDALMARVARKVADKRLLRLIRRYVEAGVMVNGVKQASTEGTPQGSPLSPLLANIMLDDLDRELERRGHRFVRYADDSVARTPKEDSCSRWSRRRRCCTRDGGRSSGAALQGEASNHHELLRSRAGVVSVVGKGAPPVHQVRARKASVSKPPIACRKRRDGVETGRSR